MHPVRTNTYDLEAVNGPVHLEGQSPLGRLTYVDVTGEKLSYGLELTLDEHPKLEGLEAHVLPELGLRVVRLEYRKDHAPDDSDYYVDIVRVAEQGERWVVRDLYLDVLVFDGVKTKILDTDEYLEALAEGHMDAAEASDALLNLHSFIDGLARHGHSLARYLGSQGVTLTWRR